MDSPLSLYDLAMYTNIDFLNILKSAPNYERVEYSKFSEGMNMWAALNMPSMEFRLPQWLADIVRTETFKDLCLASYNTLIAAAAEYDMDTFNAPVLVLIVAIALYQLDRRPTDEEVNDIANISVGVGAALKAVA